jgi:RimJ/RimL family protein N-acetyltransferase
VVEDGEAVGGAGYALRHVPGLAEVGYWIVVERRGAGLATAAVELVVEREGLLRGYARHGDGPRHDVYLFGRLR